MAMLSLSTRQDLTTRPGMPIRNTSLGKQTNDGSLVIDARLNRKWLEISRLWMPAHRDIMTVNGKPWPYLKVEPRTYRFSILNACTSREVRHMS
jgi:FtsP/CotA-like multicopper oxidase with cupredoxin domain